VIHRVGVVALTAVGLLAAGCGGGGKSSASQTTSTIPAAPKPAKGAAPWPRPDDAMALAADAGVPVGVYEYGVPGHPGKHIHAHLDVFVNGKPTPVPAGIGIDISVPGVQHGTAPDGTPTYGGIRLCSRPCIAALHTHDDSGVLHIESQKPRPYTLGEVFTEWNVRLDKKCVGGYCRPRAHIAVYENGKPYTADPAALVLKNLHEIAIVIGTPPSKIPSSYF
jgi:hypothetical protein